VISVVVMSVDTVQHSLKIQALTTDIYTRIILKLATHAPETGTSRLVPETCTCVGQSGTRFFWYQILVRN